MTFSYDVPTGEPIMHRHQRRFATRIGRQRLTHRAQLDLALLIAVSVRGSLRPADDKQ